MSRGQTGQTPVPRGVYASITKLVQAYGWVPEGSRYTWQLQTPAPPRRGQWALTATLTRDDDSLTVAVTALGRELYALRSYRHLRDWEAELPLLRVSHPLVGLTGPVVARALLATYRERLRAWEEHWDWEEREGFDAVFGWKPANGWRALVPPLGYGRSSTPRGEYQLVHPDSGPYNRPTLVVGQDDAGRVLLMVEDIHDARHVQHIECPAGHLAAGLDLLARWLDARAAWRPWRETLTVADDGTPPL